MVSGQISARTGYADQIKRRPNYRIMRNSFVCSIFLIFVVVIHNADGKLIDISIKTLALNICLFFPSGTEVSLLRYRGPLQAPV